MCKMPLVNVLIADSRTPTAALLAAVLRSRDVSVTLAVAGGNAEAHPEAVKEKASSSLLREVLWNPFSWLSSDSLMFEATSSAPLDALVLLFDFVALAPFFSTLSPAEIFLASSSAFQTLMASALKKFQARKGGQFVFMVSRRGNRSASFELNAMQYIAAYSAEAAFERCAEATAALFSQTRNSSLGTVLIKSDFSAEGFLPWAADLIVEAGAKPAKNSTKWLSRGNSLASIFQRKS